MFGIKKYFITPSYPKSYNLFGLWEHKEDIKRLGYVVVYESEKSVLKRDSLLDYSGVALSGHTISDEQVRILIGLNQVIYNFTIKQSQRIPDLLCLQSIFIAWCCVA